MSRHEGGDKATQIRDKSLGSSCVGARLGRRQTDSRRRYERRLCSVGWTAEEKPDQQRRLFRNATSKNDTSVGADRWRDRSCRSFHFLSSSSVPASDQFRVVWFILYTLHQTTGLIVGLLLWPTRTRLLVHRLVNSPPGGTESILGCCSVFWSARVFIKDLAMHLWTV